MSFKWDVVDLHFDKGSISADLRLISCTSDIKAMLKF